MKGRTRLRKRHELYVDALADRAPVAAPRPGAAEGRRAEAPSVAYLAYGPPWEDGEQCEVPASFGEPEAEYAAIRRGAALFDATHRGTLRLRGQDRRDFLDRMLTQRLSDLAPGDVRRAFRLGRQGRIAADLLAVEGDDETLIDLDIHQAEATAAGLGEFLFTEDVQIEDRSAETGRFIVDGPLAPRVLAAASGSLVFHLDPMRSCRLTVAGAEITVARCDLTGEVGLHLFVDHGDAEPVWEALLATDDGVAGGRRRVRPTGWYAYNIARIEAGTPLANVDFGPSNLPHETGVLHDRVCFEKGCYPGQEVVARTENLGRPKQRLVGLRMRGDRLPVAGSHVFPADAPPDEPLGMVTSSAPSPMLGAVPIAFALMRSTGSDEGTLVLVDAEGDQVEAEVGPLRFLPEASEDAAT